MEDNMLNKLSIFKKNKINYKLEKEQRITQININKTLIRYKDEKCYRIIENIYGIDLPMHYLNKYVNYLKSFILLNELEYTIYDYNSETIRYLLTLMYEDNFIKLNVKYFDKLNTDVTELDFYNHKNIAKILYDNQDSNKFNNHILK